MLFRSMLTVYLGLALAACAPATEAALSSTPNPTGTIQPTVTQTPSPIPTSTLTPTLTQTSIPPTPTLGIGSTLVSEKDGATLVYVPEGEFMMGSSMESAGYAYTLDGPHPFWDTAPPYSVTLAAYWIDQTEVTNRQYALCVSDNTCRPPLRFNSPTRSIYYQAPEFENFPVIHVEWNMALDYCNWAGRRLPSEAEWEKAARGLDGNIYPWGNVVPDNTLVNYDSRKRDTTEVGIYPGGKSVYHVYDMAGNVWEWTNSLYKPYPYNANDGREDISVLGLRVLRGGSWYFNKGSPRSFFRFGVLPPDILVRSDLRSWAFQNNDDNKIYSWAPYGFGTVGFRCAMSANP